MSPRGDGVELLETMVLGSDLLHTRRAAAATPVMEPKVVLFLHHVQALDSGQSTQSDVNELMMLPTVIFEDFIKRATLGFVYGDRVRRNDRKLLSLTLYRFTETDVDSALYDGGPVATESVWFAEEVRPALE
jgi:hypothetical protein